MPCDEGPLHLWRVPNCQLYVTGRVGERRGVAETQGWSRLGLTPLAPAGGAVHLRRFCYSPASDTLWVFGQNASGAEESVPVWMEYRTVQGRTSPFVFASFNRFRDRFCPFNGLVTATQPGSGRDTAFFSG